MAEHDHQSTMMSILHRLSSQMSDNANTANSDGGGDYGGDSGGGGGGGNEISVETIYTGIGVPTMEGIAKIFDFNNESMGNIKNMLESSAKQGVLGSLFGLLFRGNSMTIDTLANARYVPSLQLMKIKPGSFLGGGAPTG